MAEAAVTQGFDRWMGENQHYLIAAIAQIEGYLQSDGAPFDPPALPPLHPPAAIERLCELFGLSRFERAIVLLCTGMELRSNMTSLLATCQSDPQRAYPTFGLALHRFPHAHWNALTPGSPLRRWQLIELGAANILTHSPLRLNERILHFLLGDTQLDSQLMGIVTTLPMDAGLALPQSQQQLVGDIVALLQQRDRPPLIQLCGYDSASKRMIATAAAAKLGNGLLNLNADILPADFDKFNLIQTLWEREAKLTGHLLLLDCDNLPDATDGANAPPQVGAIARLMENCHQRLFVLSRDRRPVRQRSVISFEVMQPTATEQRQLWLQTLTSILAQQNGSVAAPIQQPAQHQVNKLVSHFSLSPLAIQTICTQSLVSALQHGAGTPAAATDHLFDRLWNACLSHARPRLEELAQPIRTQVVWADLVLPEKEKLILRAIAAQVRQRAKVYEQWGFAGKGQRGLGISALFAGASGTGKTLGAEVLANELQLDLYRIDLSSVVSKYIGETEKNLRRIFDAAELGGAILLFDEADALFGKRSEVKDSHDRYANMEVAYLLQRMEAYRGLAILTTNLKNSLDQAFLRRLRFVVQFPFPDAAQRAEIWQRVFPKDTPTANLSYPKLARLNVPGGNIRNIALNAAFLAAEAETSVQMQHILQAAQSEYIKLERPLTETEIKGWE